MHNGLPELQGHPSGIPSAQDWLRWWEQDGECFHDEDDYQSFSAAIENTAMEELFRDGTLPADAADLCLVLSFCLLLDRKIVMRKLHQYVKIEIASFDLCAVDLLSKGTTEVFAELFLKPRREEIKTFEMTRCTFSPEVFAVLCDALNLCSALDRVAFVDCQLGEDSAKHLPFALGGSQKTLTCCLLGGTSLGDQGAIELAARLPEFPMMCKLVLSRCDIGEAGASAIACALHSLDRLEKLDLSENPLGDAGGAAILSALKGKSSLGLLAVPYCGLGKQSLQALTELLASKVRLKKLSFGEQFEQPPLNASLGQALKTQVELKLLAIRSRGLPEDSVAMLIDAIGSIGGLSGLGLDGQVIVGRNAKSLARWLERSKVQVLDLSNCGLDDEASEVLMRALFKNTGLELLRYESNVMGPRACAAAAQLLKVNKTLKSMNVRHCAIDDSAITQLCYGLSGKTALFKLDVSRNRFGAQGMAALQEALRVNVGLGSLCFGSLYIAADVARACLEAVLEKNGSLTSIDTEALVASHQQDWSEIDRRLEINFQLQTPQARDYLLKIIENFSAVTIGLEDLGQWILDPLRDAPGLAGQFVGLRSALRLSEVSRAVRFGPLVAARKAPRHAPAKGSRRK